MYSLQRWGRVVVAVWLLSAAMFVGATDAAAQSAGNGLEEASVNSFEFDPDRGVVQVTIDITIRNVTTDRVEGGFINQTFFDRYFAVVPLGAENIVATRNGNVLAGELVVDPEFPAFSTYEFSLGTQLFSGQSTSIRVTYDHLGAPPRDPVPWRVNEAYAGFVAFGIGDEGLVTVRISQPSGYEFDDLTDLTGFTVSEPDGFGTVIHERTGLDELTDISVGMANDDRLVSRPLNVADVELELRSWPDDPEWADFAAPRIEAAIPALEELLGTPWPVEGSFDVRQTIEPELYGYAGWFDARSSEIAVGEALDADTIYHELSHAWLNGQLSSERWLIEGLAQVYAAELVRVDGDPPATPELPSPNDPAARPLSTWADLVDLDADPVVEEYGYDTSFWVVDSIVDEIGFDRTRDVVNAMRNGTSPYDPDEIGYRPDDDWKRAYDTFVEIGGADNGGAGTISAVFADHVVEPADAPLIDQRNIADADVTALGQRSAPWDLPRGVRNGMEQWDFDAVNDAVMAADALLEQRAVLESIEDAVNVDEHDLAGDAYAAAPIQAGGVNFEPTAVLLAESIKVGHQLQDRLAAVADASTAADASPPDVASIDGVEDFDDALEVADEQLAALGRIVEVDTALDDAPGITTWVGRIGSDIEADLDEARSLVEDGDNTAAVAALVSAEEQIDDLASAGALRLAIAGTLALLALGVLGMLVTLRRRKRSSPSASDDAGDPDSGEPGEAGEPLDGGTARLGP